MIITSSMIFWLMTLTMIVSLVPFNWKWGKIVLWFVLVLLSFAFIAMKMIKM